MSMAKKEEVCCPECGSPISFTLWDSINTMIPTAISDIITGKLFDIQCESCGYKTRVDYPILFNDMEHKVMIYYVTPEQVEETEKAAAIMKMTGAQVRIVMSQNELREKAMIFNEGLDDRVIEIVKVLTLEQLNSQLQGKQLDAIYFDVHDGDYRFALFFDDQQGMVRIDIDAVRIYAANLTELLEETKQDMIIDRSWAKRFLDTH